MSERETLKDANGVKIGSRDLLTGKVYDLDGLPTGNRFRFIGDAQFGDGEVVNSLGLRVGKVSVRRFAPDKG